MNLRDVLLDSLRSLPGTRHLHLHVLITAPRKHVELYPFATPRPRAYLQDIVVLLSEQTNLDAPRVFVSAVEAYLYNIPSTSCAILYISKVDGTGQGVLPSPTRTLVRTLLTYFADPATRPVSATHLWIQLFARAQSQYLFPNSANHPSKKPLGDVKLCSWWKHVFTDVAHDLKKSKTAAPETRLYYILPGYGQFEAERTLEVASPTIQNRNAFSPTWVYGHPYTQTDIPTPCPQSTDDHTPHNLGRYIPSFEDDPKSRFMDEIASMSDRDPGIKSPERKRSRLERACTPNPSSDQREAKPSAKEERPPGDTGTVTADEFWERMSFRQECVAGAVTAFFTLIATSPPPAEHPAEEPSPLAPQPGQVPSQLVKRAMSSLMTQHEFSTSERAAKATDTLENAIRGLCEGLSSTLPEPPRSKAPVSQKQRRRDKTPERQTTTLAPPTTPPPAGGAPPEMSPNPFPEPVTTLETYESFIYGNVFVDKPPAIAKSASALATAMEKPVTVLAVRKKKRGT